jgi:hypothetical protein
MSIEQLLRQTMHEQAATVDVAPPSLGTTARAEADAIRFRRRSAAGGVLLAVLAVFSVLAVNPFGGDGGKPEPSQPLPTVPVRTEFAGRVLIEAAETSDGRVLDLTATPPGGSEWQLLCTGVDAEYVVHYVLDDEHEDTAPCALGVAMGDPPSPQVGPPGYRIPTSAGGGRRTLRMWVTERDSEAVVSPPGAVLAAAVYTLPEPVAVLAGFEVLPVEEALDEEWSVVEYDGSEPGERSYTLELPAHPQETVLQLFASGSGTAVVRLSVDGKAVSTDPPAYPLGSVNIGDLLPPGAHAVTLRIEGEVPADAQLGIVQRERAR